MTEIRVMPSHPYYVELNALAQMIAWAKNPQLFFARDDVDESGERLYGAEVDLATPKLRDLVAVLEEEQAKLLSGEKLSSFIRELEAFKLLIEDIKIDL